jgi:hypothetical protein
MRRMPAALRDGRSPVITLESSCCRAAAGTAGEGATRHYVCSSCGLPCLAATVCTYPVTGPELRELARFRLAEYGKFFATRATARGIREWIEATPPDQVITLDFAGVADVTVSFADELVGKLACAGRRVIIEGAADDVWESLSRVLLRRDLTALDLHAPVSYTH